MQDMCMRSSWNLAASSLKGEGGGQEDRDDRRSPEQW